MEGVIIAIIIIVFIIAMFFVAIKAEVKPKDADYASNASSFKTKKMFDNNGNLLSEQRAPYHFILYYPNGSISREIKCENKKCYLTCYSEEGNIVFVFELKMEVFFSGYCEVCLSGQAQGYYPNSHLKCVGKYSEGKLSGKMDFFYENGDLQMTLNFKNDVPISGVVYTPDGKEKELTVAHINNIMVDYGLGNTDIDFSWVKDLCKA